MKQFYVRILLGFLGFALGQSLYGQPCSGGTIAGNQTICSGGDPIAFTESVPAMDNGGGGMPMYQWQESTTGCSGTFTNVPANGTSATYDPPSLPQTTYYRRQVKFIDCLGLIFSNCLEVTVNSVTGGTVAGSQTICSGTAPNAFTVTTASTGSGTLTYQWQSNTTGCGNTFTDIPNATDPTYAPSALSQTTYFRRVTTSTLNSIACTANSNCLTITINSVTGGTVSASQSICSGTAPNAFTVTTASTGSGTLSYQWQSNTTDCNGIFTNVPTNGTSATYAPPALTQTTYYKRLTRSTLNNNVCEAESNCLTVTVTVCNCPNPPSVNITQTNVNVCVNAAATFNYTVSNGPANLTENGAGSVSPSSLGNGTGTFTYTPASGDAGNIVTIVAVIPDPDGNGPCIASTDTVRAAVSGLPNATITSASTVCASSVNNPASVPDAGSNATYAWTISSGGSITSASNIRNITFSAGTGASLTLTVTVTNAVGCSSTSSKITTIQAPPSAAITTASTVCASSLGNVATVPFAGAGANYSWNVNGGTITSAPPNNTNSITYTAGTGGSLTVSVTVTSSQGCIANDAKTVTVVSLPDATITSAPSVCASSSGNTASVPNTANATYAWTISAGNSINSGNGTNSISYTAGTGTSLTFTVTVTIGSGPASCSSTSTKTIPINPLPSAAITASPSVCASSTGNSASVPDAGNNAVYAWSISSGGSITSASNIRNITYSVGTGSSITFTVTVTNSNGCTSTSSTVVNINALPSANINAPSAVCASSTGSTASVPISSSYSWGIAGGAITSGGSSSSMTFSAGTGSTVSLTVTVTNSFGCTNIGNQLVAINPIPNVTTNQSAQTICSGTQITDITFQSTNVPSATFSWTRNNTGQVTGIPASGNGTISGTLTNTTNNPVTVTFTITPTASGCNGSPITATVLVNPRPTATATPTPQSVCSEFAIQPINITNPNNVSGTTFSWIRNNTVNVTGMPGNGTGNSITGTLVNATSAPISVTFTITPTANDCAGPDINATVTVKPIPSASSNLNQQTVCSGLPIQTVVLSSNVTPPPTFAWTRNNTSIVTGMPASGSGSTIDGTLNNTLNIPVTVTFTVTPTANGCTGDPYNFTVLVNPKPNVTATPSTQAPICSGSSFSPIALSSNVITNTNFTWTRNNTTIVTGMPSSGSGTPITGTLTNQGTNIETVTFTITPTTNAGCVGLTTTATVVVNPTPGLTASPATQQPICSGATISPINLTETVANTTICWTRDNTSNVSGIPDGCDNKISGTLTNNTFVNQTVIFTITTTANGCPGVTKTASVTIKPKPDVFIDPVSQTTCSGDALLTIELTGNVANSSFPWTRNMPGITGMSNSGNGNINGTLVNTGSSATVTFTVTPTANGCTGNTATATVLVNPLPPASIAIVETSGTTDINNGIICAGETANLTANDASGYQWNWSTGETTQTIQVNVQNIFTVTVTDANTCSNTKSVAITVKQLPTPTITIEDASGDIPNDGLICGSDAITFKGAGGATYKWLINNDELNSKDVTLTSLTPGVYTSNLEVTDVNQCKNSTEKEFTVFTPPTAVIDAFAASGGLFKPYTNISFKEKSINGTADISTWSWKFGSSLDAIPPDTIFFDPDEIAKTKYASTGPKRVILTAVDGNGCINRDTVVFEISDGDCGIIGIDCVSGCKTMTQSSASVCQGDILEIKANWQASGGALVAKWFWDIGDAQLISSTLDSQSIQIKFPISGAKTIKVYFKDDTPFDTCTAPVYNYNVTVNPIPTAMLETTNSNLCRFGSELNIKYNFNPGDSKYDAVVTNIGGVSMVDNGETRMYPVPMVGSYEYILQSITNLNTQCSNTDLDILTIKVNENPTVQITPVPVCVGGNLNLVATDGFTYKWSTNDITRIYTVPNATLNSIGDSYTVTITDNNACTAVDSIKLSASDIQSNPQPVISGDLSPCNNEYDVLYTVASPSATSTFSWSVQGGKFLYQKGGKASVFWNAGAGTKSLSVTETTNANCSTTITQNIQVGTTSAPPLAEVGWVSSLGLLICTADSVSCYQWGYTIVNDSLESIGGKILQNENNQAFYPGPDDPTPGTAKNWYWVDIWNVPSGASCNYANSDCRTRCYYRTESPILGNNEPGNTNFNFRLYPNPSASQLNLEFITNTYLENADMFVFSMDGRLIKRDKLDVNSGMSTHRIDVSTYLPGVYMLAVQDRQTGEICRKAFVVQRN